LVCKKPQVSDLRQVIAIFPDGKWLKVLFNLGDEPLVFGLPKYINPVVRHIPLDYQLVEVSVFVVVVNEPVLEVRMDNLTCRAGRMVRVGRRKCWG
jgi:hypothetical protein